jgi:hypothetical protein
MQGPLLSSRDAPAVRGHPSLHGRERPGGAEVLNILFLVEPGLLELIFTRPFCKIRFPEEAGATKRQTVSKYLKDMESSGVLRGLKMGREVRVDDLRRTGARRKFLFCWVRFRTWTSARSVG